MSLHDELSGFVAGNACKVCAYISTLTPAEAADWGHELQLPVEVVGNTAVVEALKRRGVNTTESSVRRHRARHVSR